MPNSRTLPAGHEVLWRAIEAGALRGGIGQSGAPTHTADFGPDLELFDSVLGGSDVIAAEMGCSIHCRSPKFS